MGLGLALIGWDTKMGALYDFLYPKTFNITPDMLNKIYLTHGIGQENIEKEEVIEINYEDQIILSYCDKRRVVDVGYELLILIIHQNQKINLHNIKIKLQKIAREVIAKPKSERNQYLLDNIEVFFKKSTEKKIVVLGRAGTGKSSIKEIVFEGKNSKDLIYHPLEPTRGISPSVYSWLDLKLGFFDTSGQELSALLKDEYEQSIAFENSDIILYLFDFTMWVMNKNEIIEDIKEIKNIIDNKSYNVKLILFLHKIDLIKPLSREEELNKIREIINNEFGLSIFFTSIYPELIFNTYNAFYEILANFSKETLQLKEILDGALKDLSKTMFFVTNKNHSIICQASSNDFDHNLINHVHKLTAQMSQSFENMCLNDNIRQLILISSKELKVYIRFLNLGEFDLMNIICVSETLRLQNLYNVTKRVMELLAILYEKL